MLHHPCNIPSKVLLYVAKVIAETKVETTGDATRLELTPDRKTINADGQDVSVFTVSTVDAQGRLVPVAQNKIRFGIEGAGSIIGVGNGDPSSHEPDVYVPAVPGHVVAVKNWRWELANIPKSSSLLPEYANDFDDSKWKSVHGNGSTIEARNTGAIFRAHVNLTEQDLKGEAAVISFSGCDDEGWYFVNNQFVGESHDWQARTGFDIKKYLHVGDNVIAVGVFNGEGQGGLNPDVDVQITEHPVPAAWSRSLFNGLAQIIVQSTRNAGDIKLSAMSDGLAPATVTVQAQPCAPKPSVP